MSRLSKRTRGEPSPDAKLETGGTDVDDARSTASEVNELDEDEYEKERLENIKYVSPNSLHI